MGVAGLSPPSSSMFVLALASIALTAALGTSAHPLSSRTVSAPGLGNWYHDNEHPLHQLFRRRGKRDGPSPSVGSPEWTAQYPSSTPSTSDLPQEWVNAYNDAVKNGKIPNFPPSTSVNGASPVYPGDTNAQRNDPSICAWTDRSCQIPGNVYNAPDGVIGIGFDDGPTPDSPTLYDFLKSTSQRSTHYMIGINILQNWQEFNMAYNDISSDIAVHTWTHPQMTTLSDLDLVAQFGWTIQIIYDSTDGKVPRYWRPPYGDIDMRVNAIAKEVFGMDAILWNQDTEDWSMLENPPATNLSTIQTQMQQWLGGSKSPGLIILEHELANSTIQGFINMWPLVSQNSWKPVSQALLASNDTKDFGDASMDSTEDEDDVYQDGSESDGAFNSFLSTSTSSSSTTSASGTLASDQSSSTSTASQSSGAHATMTSAHFSSTVIRLLIFSSLFLF